MINQTITCPKCHHEFQLDEAFQQQFDEEVKQSIADAIAQEKLEGEERERKSLEARDEEHQKELKRIHDTTIEEIEERNREQSEKLEETEYKLGRAQKRLKERDEEYERDLKRARDETEEEVTKRQARALEEANIARQKAEKTLGERDEEHERSLTRVREEAKEELEAARKEGETESDKRYRLKLEEKDEEIRRLGEKAAEMERRARQGSIERQGEALEVYMKKALTVEFPLDTFEDVKRGRRGADILQHVTNHMGQRCGAILWEMKNTKNWDKSWLGKVREDAEREGNALPVIVSVTLPKELQTADCIDGVWVSSVDCSLLVGQLLRQQLLETSTLQRAMVGRENKMEAVYAYVVSDQFRNRIERIIDTWKALSKQIDDEERVMESQWSLRRKQLKMVLNLTTDMHSEFKSLVGAELPQIEDLSLAALPSGAPED